MIRSKHPLDLLKWPILIGALAYGLSGVSLYFRGPTDDLERRWREAGYVMHGYDPIAVARAGAPVLERYGPIPPLDGYPPWSYAFAEILVPPWLPFPVTKLLFLGFNLCALGAIAWIVARAAAERGLAQRRVFLVAAVLCCSAVHVTLRHGQYGILVCAFVLGFLELERRGKSLPAGLCLALAMIKPQIGGLFAFVPLVRRSYATLVWCALFEIGATLLVSWQCHTPPWTLVDNIRQTGLSNQFYVGILDPLKESLEPRVLLMLSVALFATIALALMLRYRRLPIFVLAAVPATFATIWMSHRVHDLLIVSLLLAPLLWLAFETPSPMAWRLALLVGLSHWLPHLSRYYFGPWLVPLAYRVFWIVALAILLEGVRSRHSSSAAFPTGIATP